MTKIAVLVLTAFIVIGAGSAAVATHCGDGQQHTGPCQWGHPPIPGVTCVCQ